MPWRKYTPNKGKYGLIYHIARGIQVRKDPQGNWVLFIEKNGYRKNKTYGSDRNALSIAIKAGEALASKLDPNGFYESAVKPESKLPLFKDYSKRWLDNGVGRWDEQTYDRYECVLRIHILPSPAFKNKRLDEINRSLVKDFLRGLQKIRSAKTVELAQIIIYGIFDDAIDDEIMQANPASRILKKVLPPKNKRTVYEPDPFEIKERDLFLEAAAQVGTMTEVLILKVMVFAGFRLGEALAMRFENLDFNKKNYHITQSFKLKRFRLPKKGKKRFVDFPDFLMDELERYITHLKRDSFKNGRGGHVDLLFVDPEERDGSPYSQRKVQGFMKKVCKKAGIRKRNPHDLRHTYASILLMSGKSPAYVQEQLGHSSISITCDVYGHWIPGMGREGLEDALFGSVQQSHIIAYNEKRLQ